MKISHGLIACWIALALASPAFAEEKADEKKSSDSDANVEKSSDAKSEDAKEEEEEEEKAWSVGVRMGSRIGQGTFVSVSGDTEFQDDTCIDPIVQGCVGPANNAFDRVNLSYGISGSYSWKDFNFSTGLTLVHWLTPGGGLNKPHEVRLSDSGLGIGYKGWNIESIDVSISPSLGLQFPTSKFAQVATLVVGSSLGVSLSKTLFDKLGVSLNIGVGKDFHRFKGPLLDVEHLKKKGLTDDDITSLAENVTPDAAVYRDTEEVQPGLVAIGGINTEWSLSTGVSAGFAVWDKLRLSASYNFSTGWTYAHDPFANDDFTPDQEGVQTGKRQVGQSFGTSVGLSYPYKIKDVRLGFSAGIGTGGYPKTSDNKSFRFPFWNTSGAAQNSSSVRLGVSASY